MSRIFNRANEKEKRRKLRNNMTGAEKLLWERIRRRQLRNKRFLRQYSVEKYVLDFYCPEIKLAIEVDGDTHESEEETFVNIENVILKIETFINKTPLNPPFCKGGK